MRVSHFPLLVASMGGALLASCGDSASVVGNVPSVSASGDGADQQDRDAGEAQRLAALDRWNAPAATIDEYGPYQIELGNGTFGYLQQISAAADASSLLLPGIGGKFLFYSLFVDETQAIEFFSLFVPNSPSNERQPLLTAFHGFGTSHADIAVRTSFFQEADERDWYLIAPLQRSLADPTGANIDIHFSSAQSQLHVEAVMGFVLDNYSIDRDRIYGVGFSMGGGGAMSFAARHRDRRTGSFAAVVNHTGTIALTDVYNNLPPNSPVIDIMELIFGGTPQDAPFEWLRSSLIEVDDNGFFLAGGRHMAGNLAHLPVQTWYNASDSQAYLVEQCIELHSYFQSLSSTNHELRRVSSSNAPGCRNTQHCWGSLDQTMACDWLSQHRLNSFPAAGSILADRDGRWEYFDLVQAQADAFSGVGYEIDVLGDTVTLVDPLNLESLAVTLFRLGLQSTDSLKVNLTGFDAHSTDLIFNDVVSPPQSVIREGTLLVGDCSGATPTMSSWCYDPSTETLTLTEVEGAFASWRINF